MSEVESIKSEKLKGEKAKTQKPIKVMNRKKNLQKATIALFRAPAAPRVTGPDSGPDRSFRVRQLTDLVAANRPRP